MKVTSRRQPRNPGGGGFVNILIAAFCLGALSWPQCAAGESGRPAYHLFWTVTRVSDHVRLLAVSAPATLGREASLRTDSLVATETKPAFPRFSARITKSPDRPGELSLLTKVLVFETAPNKKGKLRRSKRCIGALTPIHPGETQVVSSASDPIQIELRLEQTSD